MFNRLLGGSRFIRRMNKLLKIYADSHNASVTYKQLEELEPLIRTEGERSLYDLNRASLLYDMKRYKEAADIMIDMPSVNMEFDARAAEMKTKLMDAMWYPEKQTKNDGK